jgi:hypothetical protein
MLVVEIIHCLLDGGAIFIGQRRKHPTSSPHCRNTLRLHILGFEPLFFCQ